MAAHTRRRRRRNGQAPSKTRKRRRPRASTRCHCGRRADRHHMRHPFRAAWRNKRASTGGDTRRQRKNKKAALAKYRKVLDAHRRSGKLKGPRLYGETQRRRNVDRQ